MSARDGRQERVWVDGVKYDLKGRSRSADYQTIRSAGPLYEPDPAWVYVDEAGHWHGTSPDEHDRYPTMTQRSRPCDGACHDPTHREFYWVCTICHEEIDPGRRVANASGEHTVKTGEHWDFTVAPPSGPGVNAWHGQPVNLRYEVWEGAVMTLRVFGIADAAWAVSVPPGGQAEIVLRTRRVAIVGYPILAEALG